MTDIVDHTIVDHTVPSASDEFRLEITGKVSLIIELAEYGPMEFRTVDKDLVRTLLQAVLDAADDLELISQTKAQSRRLAKILED